MINIRYDMIKKSLILIIFIFSIFLSSKIAIRLHQSSVKIEKHDAFIHCKHNFISLEEPLENIWDKNGNRLPEKFEDFIELTSLDKEAFICPSNGEFYVYNPNFLIFHEDEGYILWCRSCSNTTRTTNVLGSLGRYIPVKNSVFNDWIQRFLEKQSQYLKNDPPKRCGSKDN